MTGMAPIVIGGITLGAGTFAFRLAGATLKSRMTVSPRTQRVLTAASVVLLVALVATLTLLQDDGFSGWARPCGVAVGGGLAWRKAPFVLVVLAAAAVTAGLRQLGVS